MTALRDEYLSSMYWPRMVTTPKSHLPPTVSTRVLVVAAEARQRADLGLAVGERHVERAGLVADAAADEFLAVGPFAGRRRRVAVQPPIPPGRK